MGVFESPAAIERHEALAGQRELHHQHGAGLAGGAIDDVLLDFSILESGSSDSLRDEF